MKDLAAHVAQLKEDWMPSELRLEWSQDDGYYGDHNTIDADAMIWEHSCDAMNRPSVNSCTDYEIVDAIFKIPGVERVELTTYSITIHKARLFPWAPIKSAVEQAIRENVATGDDTP